MSPDGGGSRTGRAKSAGRELWETVTCKALTRAGCANSHFLSNSVPHQAASNRPGRASWVPGARRSLLALNNQPKIKILVLLLTSVIVG